MTFTISDPATANALASSTGWVELHGPDGRVIGRFTSASRTEPRFPELDITDAEMDRRLHDPNAKWVTADEVMARLQSLRSSP